MNDLLFWIGYAVALVATTWLSGSIMRVRLEAEERRQERDRERRR